VKKISIHSNKEYDTPDKKVCKSIIRYITKIEKIDSYEISVIFTSDIFVSDLKNRFFSENKWTDVIAFPLHNSEEKNIEGEIYISMPTAKENAKKYNQSYEKEVARLIIHGVLHLIGYSDQSEKEKKIMSTYENSVLKQIKWKDLFIK
tara:strand:+ start:45 stop:488 length:444 start_codon:yes stop_codon:yes gene_type:complete